MQCLALGRCTSQWRPNNTHHQAKKRRQISNCDDKENKPPLHLRWHPHLAGEKCQDRCTQNLELKQTRQFMACRELKHKQGGNKASFVSLVEPKLLVPPGSPMFYCMLSRMQLKPKQLIALQRPAHSPTRDPWASNHHISPQANSHAYTTTSVSGAHHNTTVQHSTHAPPQHRKMLSQLLVTTVYMSQQLLHYW